jgi:hypothetical protein
VGRHCVDIFARHLHLQLGDALAQEFLVGHDCLVVIGLQHHQQRVPHAAIVNASAPIGASRMSRIDCSPVLGGNGGDGRVPAAIENLAVP